MKRTIAAGLLIISFGLGACSSTSDGTTIDTNNADSSVASATTAPDTVQSTSTSTAPPSGQDCEMEKKTLVVAIQAFNAQAGRYPTGMDELTQGTTVDGAQIDAVLKRAPKYWGLAEAHDGTVVAIGENQGNAIC